MIFANIHVEHVKAPKAEVGLLLAVLPKFEQANDWERVMWVFFLHGFQLARERVTEQCAAHFKTGIGMNLPAGKASKNVEDELRARGRLRRAAATISVSEGMCLWMRSPFASEDPLEVAGLATVKEAYEVVSDFWAEGEKTNAENDLLRVMELVRVALAALPVFPK